MKKKISTHIITLLFLACTFGSFHPLQSTAQEPSDSPSFIALATTLAAMAASAYLWHNDKQKNEEKSHKEQMNEDIERLVMARIALREALITKKEYEIEVEAILNKDSYTSQDKAMIIKTAKKQLQALIAAHNATRQTNKSSD